MLQLLAQSESFPQTMVEVLAWPVGLTAAAVLLFYAGIWADQRYKKTPWKWATLIPLLIAVYLGINDFQNFRDPIYNNYVTTLGGTNKMTAAHWGAFVIPFVGLVGVALLYKFSHRLTFNLDD